MSAACPIVSAPVRLMHQPCPDDAGCRVPVAGQMSHFRGADGVNETHMMFEPTRYASFGVQLRWLEQAYRSTLLNLGLAPRSCVLRRLFCSDLANQQSELQTSWLAGPRSGSQPCATSIVGQTPALPAKVALWAYHIDDPRGSLDVQREGGTLILRRGEVKHHWTTGLMSDGPDSADQTRRVFADYSEHLQRSGMTLADNVLRTWLFVRDIDTNYRGMVEARKALFARHGLTAQTHYITSSGIEARHGDPAQRVILDAYAVAGLRPGQVTYLKALDDLSPTHIYGVTFERGAAIAWRDRMQVLLSGTASIDREGQIVHVGDVAGQLDRTIHNMNALLNEAGAGLADMTALIVYLRDPSDADAVRAALRRRLPETPMQLVTAPVCRPGWLVEIEGLALVPADRPDMPAF